MDFIEALPRVDGKSVILTIVDRFSKYCHFVPLAHPYSAESVAQAFFSDIVRLHGIPQSIVFDRGSSVHVAVLEGAHAPGRHQAPYDDGVLPAV
jgi:IS30 family transposase